MIRPTRSVPIGVRTLAAVCCAVAVLVAFATTASAAAVSCAQARALHYDRQMNVHAWLVLVRCGLVPSVRADGRSGSASPLSPLFGGGANIDAITGGETFPHVTQSEDQIWAHGTTVVVNYNDTANAPANYSGISRSTDSGLTYTRLLPSPFATGHGTNFGDPILVFDQKLNRWFGGDLVAGCGSAGIGLWSSNNGLNWTVGACVHSGASGDRESMYVDNNPTSPFYGRMYVSWNDYSVGGGALVLSHSDNGVTWTPEVLLSTSFRRDVQLSVGVNGTMFVAAMDEGGGGFNPRQNFIYRSSDGGATFASTGMGAPFAAPGDTAFPDGYFVGFRPIWRHMGWGDLGVCTASRLAYAYAQHGAGSDAGNIMVVRSTDDGFTWSPPVRIDGAAGVSSQWMPSLVGSGNTLYAGWYDRRNSTDGVNYERWGRTSFDCGATWNAPQPISDVLIDQPAQPDPNFQADNAGDYMRSFILGDYVHDAWTDGRFQIAGINQQDVVTRTMDVVPPAHEALTIAPAVIVQTSRSFTVRWSATDGGSGVGSFDVYNRSSLPTQPGYGPYNLWQSATSAHTATFTGSMGASYCLYVKARDNAGNLNPQPAGRCTELPVDDRALSIKTGPWTTGTGRPYYGGTFTKSSKVGAELTTPQLYARRIGVLADKCPTCGSITIKWNGASIGTFSLVSSTTLHRQLIGYTIRPSLQHAALTIHVARGTPVIDGALLGK